MSEKRNDAKHSPTPWRTREIGNDIVVEDGEYSIVADVWGGKSVARDADAAYIVESVNAHGRLVEELGDANEYIEHLKDQLKNYERMVGLVRRMADELDSRAMLGTCDDLLREARAAIGEEAAND